MTIVENLMEKLWMIFSDRYFVMGGPIDMNVGVI